MYITINLQETLQDTRGQQVSYDLLDSLPILGSAMSICKYNKIENFVGNCANIATEQTSIPAVISDTVLKNSRSFSTALYKSVLYHIQHNIS